MFKNYYFFRRNPYDYQVLKINDSNSLLDSNFDFDRKVKVLTHGWLNNGFGPMPESIKEGTSVSGGQTSLSNDA